MLCRVTHCARRDSANTVRQASSVTLVDRETRTAISCAKCSQNAGLGSVGPSFCAVVLFKPVQYSL